MAATRLPWYLPTRRGHQLAAFLFEVAGPVRVLSTRGPAGQSHANLCDRARLAVSGPSTIHRPSLPAQKDRFAVLPLPFSYRSRVRAVHTEDHIVARYSHLFRAWLLQSLSKQRVRW